jgi:hypothetical protein
MKAFNSTLRTCSQFSDLSRNSITIFIFLCTKLIYMGWLIEIVFVLHVPFKRNVCLKQPVRNISFFLFPILKSFSFR